MRSRLVLAALFGLVSSSAFGASAAVRAAGPRADLGTLIPQGAVTLTPTATLTAVPTASASPTFTPQPGSGDGGGGGGPGGGGGSPSANVPTLSAGMLALLALGLATFAVLLIRRP
jgi:hypothetical protein